MNKRNWSVQYTAPENSHTLPPPLNIKGLEFPGGGGSLRPKHLEKWIKLNSNFQRGKGVLEKLCSLQEV